MVKEHHKGELERKYKIAEMGLKHVSYIEQRTTAKSANKQFHQNRQTRENFIQSKVETKYALI